MIQSQKIVEQDFKNIRNCKTGSTLAILEQIHNKDVNITIYDRDTIYLKKEIERLLNLNIELSTSGDMETVLSSVRKAVKPEEDSLIIQDIHKLLQLFKEISGAKSFRLLLTTVSTNMCKKFHTDINDLRMLCTYSGPGTLWLAEDNSNQEVIDSGYDSEDATFDKSRIQQAKTGSVVILKGAIYRTEGTKAVVHRSPTIEETGEKRLLLRIDTNEFLNFDL